MQQEVAETEALRVLAWLAAQDDLLEVFMGATGTGRDDIRARAGEADFLASLLDFVLMDDAWVLGAAEALGVPPERIAKVRAALPGGALPNWT